MHWSYISFALSHRLQHNTQYELSQCDAVMLQHNIINFLWNIHILHLKSDVEYHIILDRAIMETWCTEMY